MTFKAATTDSEIIEVGKGTGSLGVKYVAKNGRWNRYDQVLSTYQHDSAKTFCYSTVPPWRPAFYMINMVCSFYTSIDTFVFMGVKANGTNINFKDTAKVKEFRGYMDWGNGGVHLSDWLSGTNANQQGVKLTNEHAKGIFKGASPHQIHVKIMNAGGDKCTLSWNVYMKNTVGDMLHCGAIGVLTYKIEEITDIGIFLESSRIFSRVTQNVEWW